MTIEQILKKTKERIIFEKTKCVKQCKLNVTKNICLGCGRTFEELKQAYEESKKNKT